jgi:hypothetical protein
MSHQERIEYLLRAMPQRGNPLKTPRSAETPCEGEGIARYTLNKISEYRYKPAGWKKPYVTVPYPSGIPPKALVIKLVEASYSTSPPADIEGWTLIKSTPTVKFYKKENTIIVAIRGTADLRDVSSWYDIAKGVLNKTARMREDEMEVAHIRKEYPTTRMYGVGHSAGGAIIDVLIAKGQLIAGVTYNPAVEKQYFNSKKNYRIYMENDPLYNLIGKYSHLGEVRKQKGTSSFDPLAGVQSVKAHLLSNFKGGGGVSSPNDEQEEEESCEGEGIIGDVAKKVKSVFTPRLDSYTNASQKIIKKYGDQEITAIQIKRTPIAKVLDSVLNLISLGKWKSAKKEQKVDDLFHLAMIVTVGGKQIVVEKNASIDLSTSFKTTADTQVLAVPLSGRAFTLNEMLEKARKKVGDQRYFAYDPFTNNCQFFIKYLLEAVRLYTPAAKTFLFQDLTKIVENLPSYVTKVAKTVTTTGALVDKWRGKGDLIM